MCESSFIRAQGQTTMAERMRIAPFIRGLDKVCTKDFHRTGELMIQECYMDKKYT